MNYLKFLITNQLKTPTRIKRFNFYQNNFVINPIIIQNLNTKIQNYCDLEFEPKIKAPNFINRVIRKYLKLKGNYQIVSLQNIDFQVEKVDRNPSNNILLKKTSEYVEFRKQQSKLHRQQLLEQIEFNVHVDYLRNKPVGQMYKDVENILRKRKEKLY